MTFTTKTQATFEIAVEVINDLADYWPLTLRQIYYRLVARQAIANRYSQYRRMSRILSDARIAGLLPWECMEDRSRSLLSSGGWPDRRSFVADELEKFLVGYRRDLLQSQDIRLEVWIEKDALSSIVHRAAFPLCVPVVVAKGFSSTTYVNECRDRIERDERPTTVLYYGDFDPSGWAMPEAMDRKLVDQLGVDREQLTIKRCALLPEQIAAYELPEDPEAMKPLDPRTKQFKRKFGDHISPVELDALPPDVLQTLVRESIEAEIDLQEFRLQRAAEAEDICRLDGLSEQVQKFVAKLNAKGDES
jgi:hypothetical protein